MLRASAIALVAAGAALTGGCADLMQRSTIAPEWFQAKAVEVKGEGYPEFKDIPTAQGIKGALAQWEAEASGLRQEKAKLEALGTEDPILTDEEVRATAAQWRAQVEEGAAVAPESVQP